MNTVDVSLRMYNRLFIETQQREEGDTIENLKKNLEKLEVHLEHFYTVENAQTVPPPQPTPLQTGGRGKAVTRFILGRHRRLIRKGRTQYIRYKGHLLTLSEARKLSKTLGKK